MTIKSLTITEDAYTALKTMKHGDESFSEVILRISQEKVGAAAKFFGAWKDKSDLTKSVLKNIKEHRALLEKEYVARAKRFSLSGQRA